MGLPGTLHVSHFASTWHQSLHAVVQGAATALVRVPTRSAALCGSSFGERPLLHGWSTAQCSGGPKAAMLRHGRAGDLS